MSKSDAIFQWLHLSDIHFSSADKTEFNTMELQDSLLEYLKKLGKVYDCMIITGDFRFAPEKVENETNIVNYIHQLSSTIEIPKDRIITIPGNHDLTRGPFREIVIDGLRQKYDPQKGIIISDCIKTLTKDFDFYFKVKNNIHNKFGWDRDDSDPHTIVEMDNCVLLLMNTAITSYGDSDKGNLIVGIQHLKKLVNKVKKTKKPIILVGHHDLEWLQQKEKEACLTFFVNKNINLYLCGHRHETTIQKHGNTLQVTVGSLKQNDNDVDATFSTGRLYSNGTVKIDIHEWRKGSQKWIKLPTEEYKNLYPKQTNPKRTGSKPPQSKKLDYPFTISKFQRIPPDSGKVGVKYIWKKNEIPVESVTFNKRLKNRQNPDDDGTSAYTISTSIGCILSAMKCPCKFCQTGANKDFMPLTAEDIALQCIFMAKYDMDCLDHPEVRNHKREFAFMGQGEPGYHYDVVKKAILLNDLAMDKLGQSVSRYIISTFGNSDFLSSLIQDYKSGIYKNKVSVHFSLHSIGEDRDKLMPINKHYNYREFIKLCKKYYQLTKEKIGVGILLFDNYRTFDAKVNCNLEKDKLKRILEELDKNVFRIDLCTLNNNSVGYNNDKGSNKRNELENYVKENGFECKLFESFGDSFQLGCGMLSSTIGDEALDAGDSTIEVYNAAVQELDEAKKKYEETILEIKAEDALDKHL